jgi:hypothetical protein
VTAIELVDFEYIILCIHRSTHSNFWTFLNNLEMVIQIVYSRNTRIILCGYWKLNFMQDNVMLID